MFGGVGEEDRFVGGFGGGDDEGGDEVDAFRVGDGGDGDILDRGVLQEDARDLDLSFKECARRKQV